jgi:hypothetical protein
VTNSTGGGIIYFDAGALAEKQGRHEDCAETLERSFSFPSSLSCSALMKTFVCICAEEMNALSSHESHAMAVILDWLPLVSMRSFGHKCNRFAPFRSLLLYNRIICN